MKQLQAIAISAIVIPGVLLAAQATKKTWDFEKDEPGKIAAGFTGKVGTWEVADDGGNKVIHQKAKNEDAVFNVALNEPVPFVNVASAGRSAWGSLLVKWRVPL